jgi:Asp-tRNA(Asn)/Glu-tRNA(Gln) amidotransferase A subunit family amidase
MVTNSTDGPWLGDACSLVDAFRAGERSPLEELDASLAAIEASDLNCFSHVDPEWAGRVARSADVAQPFGGVPVAVKELEPVTGWPWSEASLVYRDRVAPHTSRHIRRLLERGGAVPIGQTTASEFGGLNVSVSKRHGVTHNPWRFDRTVGGSSGGSAAAVAGGLVSLATGSDGGGSIRIPAGYTGMLGMKGTFGRIPRSPHAFMRPNTVVPGCVARSVRDAARYYDVCAGVDAQDPTTLPSPGGWEAGLGTQVLRGRRVGVVLDLGGIELDPGVEEHLEAEADALIAATGLERVDLTVEPPNMAALWMMGNLATLRADLGPRWPGQAGQLTDELAIGLRLAQSLYNLDTAAAAELQRIEANEIMATAFDQVDFIIAATNPGPAFPADAAMSDQGGNFVAWAKSSAGADLGLRGLLVATRVASVAFPRLPAALIGQAATLFPDLVSMGALTMISNLYGNPAVSIPAGTQDGLPLGLQVLAPHHADALLFDVALAAERSRPWPLVASAARL